MRNILYISKDVLCKSYLPLYGNKIIKTPNIDELAGKGTVFMRHYTGAPSTVMSNICMCTGEFAYEGELKTYSLTHKKYPGETMFDKAESLGYECHIIWDTSWIIDDVPVMDVYDCYGRDTKIHYVDLRQAVGPHSTQMGKLTDDPERTEKTIEKLMDEVGSVFRECADKPLFLWIHLPHVLAGRTGYGEDIEDYDKIIGLLRGSFDDDRIYISADHGNMNGVKGKWGYGFYVYEPSIAIPLITPRIDGRERVEGITCNIDMYDILFENKIKEHEYIYSDSAFYTQAHRKLAIVSDRYKYIYNKEYDTEELYDLIYDPHEDFNLIADYGYDEHRGKKYSLREVYFYPGWDEAAGMRDVMRERKKAIWRDASFNDKVHQKLRYYADKLGIKK